MANQLLKLLGLAEHSRLMGPRLRYENPASDLLATGSITSRPSGDFERMHGTPLRGQAAPPPQAFDRLPAPRKNSAKQEIREGRFIDPVLLTGQERVTQADYPHLQNQAKPLYTDPRYRTRYGVRGGASALPLIGALGAGGLGTFLLAMLFEYRRRLQQMQQPEHIDDPYETDEPGEREET